MSIEEKPGKGNESRSEEEMQTCYPHPADDGCSLQGMPEPYGVARKDQYTIEDVYALPDGVRAELMDGKLYFMAGSCTLRWQIILKRMEAAARYTFHPSGFFFMEMKVPT